jgi:DNA (cytosine-5)-methyltransferase 1
MRYLSICSGIEAASVAWGPLGWSPVAFSEIADFPSAVLAHHYPGVPNWGDLTKFREWPDADFDVLVGGTPCQSFSLAGLRKGMADPRGNLALTYLAVADRYRPDWLVWENVPGVLSSNDGRDFGAFLGALGELGYWWAYRVLDAQYYGVPQRRRRVFVVGCLGDRHGAASVLFERESLQGHPSPRRAPGQEIAAAVAPSFTGSGRGVARTGESRGQDPVVALCLNAKGGGGRLDAESETFVCAPAAAYRTSGNCGAWSTGDKTGALTTGTDPNSHDVAIQERAVSEGASGPGGRGWQEGVAYTLEARHRPQNVATPAAVRRLTPTEFERLQGFPDGYTDVPYRGKRAADGPRYKALGNSMAAPVMRWLGERIQLVCDVLAEEAA